MNRDLKDLQRPDDAVVPGIPVSPAEASAETPANTPVNLNPILIKLTDAQQEELAAIIDEDYRNATEAREKTDWGASKSGDALSFDKKYAELFELYEGATVACVEKWMCGRS